MEDYSFFSLDILKNEKDELKSFFGVMDGHGGKTAAQLATTELPGEFKEMWGDPKYNVKNWENDAKKTENFFKRLFINVDRTLAK